MPKSGPWDDITADAYDDDESAMFDPEIVAPAVDLLAELAGPGPALEFAIGTGRLAIPLLRRGVRTVGLDLSRAMLARLREKIPADELDAVMGDMATTRVPGDFSLVFLAFNSISNLCTQDEQIACFRNAARHLIPGGHFVVELFVPPLRRLPPGQSAVLFAVGADHTGFDTLNVVTQAGTSHHYTRGSDGSVRYSAMDFRYIWPSECDLMGQLAGLDLVARYADWDRTPFTAYSDKHVSVWRKSLGPNAGR